MAGVQGQIVSAEEDSAAYVSCQPIEKGKAPRMQVQLLGENHRHKAMSLGNAAKELYRLAMREGYASQDYSVIYDYLTTIHQKPPASPEAQLHQAS